MINPFPTAESRALRITLTLLAVGVSGGVVALLAELWDSYPAMRAARRHLHDSGYLMILFFVVAVPVGTALHSAPAAASGLSVRRAWSNVARLLVYGALVAAVAGLVAPLAPDGAPDSRYDVVGIYPAWLACVLLPFAVLACAGGLFVRPRRGREDPTDFSLPWSSRAAVPAEPRGAGPTPARRVDRALFTTGLLGWMVGGPLLVLLLIVGFSRMAVTG